MRLIFTALLVLALSQAKAQTVDFIFPSDGNKKFSVSVFNGQKLDTLAAGTISMMGMGKFIIPQSYKDIPMLVTLNIDGNTPLNLIINKESFSISKNADNKFIFNGNLENDILHNQTADINDPKYDTSYAQSLYKTSQAVGEAMRALNPQRGVRFDIAEQSSARLELLNNTNVDYIYNNGYWTYVIDCLMKLSAGQEGFAKDMIRLLDKTKTERVYVALVEDLITITNQFGLDDAFDIIIPHVEQSGRIEYPQGNVYDAFAMARVRKGTIAPALDGLKIKFEDAQQKYSLLIFHQPGCESCQEQLTILQQRHHYLGEKGVRVISISGALEQNEFELESKDFMWEDKLCDLKGFAGSNFLKYGIIGTPTLYLVDQKGEILGRFSRIIEIEKYLNSIL